MFASSQGADIAVQEVQVQLPATYPRNLLGDSHGFMQHLQSHEEDIPILQNLYVHSIHPGAQRLGAKVIRILHALCLVNPSDREGSPHADCIRLLGRSQVA